MSLSESGTTTSSRLRQFGLYKTIDARTEEFLKLSRRRQIRQGCACAAVSTAITVTVVVGFLLVYEYGFRSESPQRPRWLTMFNDSDGFEEHLQQTNLNLNTLKLLLKALKHNQYLEKAIEDSPTPANEQTTNYPFERNIFADAKNWIRMPRSRLYAIEYKLAPIVFFKTRNMDNFAKSIKDMKSQRIMSYIDRMIHEKVISYNKKVPTTPPPKFASSAFRLKEQRQQINRVKNSEITPSNQKDKDDCKCDYMGDILKKVMNSIQQLNLPCSGSTFKATTQKSTTSFAKNRTKSAKMITINNTGCATMKKGAPSKCHPESQISRDKESKLKFTPKPKRENYIPNVWENIRSMPNEVPQIASKSHENLNVYASHAGTFEDTTATKSYIEPTETLDLRRITTTTPFSRKKVKHRAKDQENFKRHGDEMDLAEAIFSQKFTKTHIASHESITKDTVLKSEINSEIGLLKSLSMQYQKKEYESSSNFPYSKPTTNHNKFKNHRDDTKIKSTTPINKLINCAILNLPNNKSATEVSNAPEYLLLEHQGGEQDFGDQVYSPASTATVNYKNSALSQFLQKLEESNKYNLKYPDHSVSKSYGTPKRPLQDSSTLRYYPGINDASFTESLNSMISSRPQFLEIRRNDGKREWPERHYDDDTNMNDFIYY